MGTPVPAMQPLHPLAPPPKIIEGQIWGAIAHGKTSVNRPRCQVTLVEPRTRRSGDLISYRRLDCHGGAAMSEKGFRLMWEPA